MQERQDTGSDAAFTGASSNNQLVAAANPLLNAIPQIRHSVSHDDQVALRQRLIDEIRRFEVRCQQAGLAYEVIVGARYCLCTALDEAAALTPGAAAVSGQAMVCWSRFITKPGAAKSSSSCWRVCRRTRVNISSCWR